CRARGRRLSPGRVTSRTRGAPTGQAATPPDRAGPDPRTPASGALPIDGRLTRHDLVFHVLEVPLHLLGHPTQRVEHEDTDEAEGDCRDHRIQVGAEVNLLEDVPQDSGALALDQAGLHARPRHSPTDALPPHDMDTFRSYSQP